MRAVAVLAGVLLLGAACEKHEFERPDRAAQVAQADSLFDPALFDTIQWTSDEARLSAGNEVFAVHCRKCHGPLKKGDTPYAREQGLSVPSLVEPDWPHASSPVAVRRRIFGGHPAGMPTWGVAGISPREIDAVAHYIVYQLRADAQEAAAAGRR